MNAQERRSQEDSNTLSYLVVRKAVENIPMGAGGVCYLPFYFHSMTFCLAHYKQRKGECRECFSLSSFPAYWALPHWWWAHFLAICLGLLCLENWWRALEVLFLGDIVQDTAEGKSRKDTGHIFIQKWFGKEDCLFFSLLSSHVTTLLQLTVFRWLQWHHHEDGKRHFLKRHTCLATIHTLGRD